MSDDSLEKKYQSSPFFGGNAAFLEDLYEQYLTDPESLDAHWRDYFRGFEAGQPGEGDVPHGPIRDEFARRARESKRAGATEEGFSPALAKKQNAVMRLIQAYRGRGHRRANLDPLGLAEKPEIPDLTLRYHGLSQSDLDTEFAAPSLDGADRRTLRDIVKTLENIYCSSIGHEYLHVASTEEREWIQQRIEGTRGRASLSEDEKKNILRQLTGAEGIEKYLHTRYVGQKRFSLEGGESMIPMLDDVIQRSGANGVHEIVLGMAHRGRINVLINVLGKSPQELFSEFEGVYDPRESEEQSGDVKYHMGFSSDIKTPGGNVHLAMAFNPSHLELVNPVVEGSVRARQDRRDDEEGGTILPVLVHGDASFAGQGVVMETLQMSQTRGFHTGGTLHIMCNNQIGFTTSDPRDARSTTYSTDVAKMIEAPIFHVNADDVEAVIFVTRLAMEYRTKFHKDVVVDLVCYRRHGHNEADEPAATQPLMYKTIRKHPTVRKQFADRLVEEGVVGKDEPKQQLDDYRKKLDEGETMAPSMVGMIGNEYTVDWDQYNQCDWDEPVDTSIPHAEAKNLAAKFTSLPEGFKLHSRVQRIIDDRKKMADGELPMDWGFAETLAYASLLSDGFSVRLTGQDSGRGTFFHRHAKLYNQEDATEYFPLGNTVKDGAVFRVTDSLLSEQGVVGFEYGYSTADPNSLVVWEAQFGDFGNGAQVIIDQFISSGEAKWGRLCGLVMFLPHGYEGQGPEHSSARLERYMQLCGQHNMQVCVPSTPAQMFHMLRRQMVRHYRKPLIVMTPKSLLRHKQSVSELEYVESGRFRLLIDEIDDLDRKKVKRLVFCSGKVYYDLLERRRTEEMDDIALIRLEQLYPFPQKSYREVLEAYPNAGEVIWCQEEPMNQGAWYHIRHRLQEQLDPGHTLTYAGRPTAASTAAGYFQLHLAQQKQLVGEALGLAEVADYGDAPRATKSSKKTTAKKKSAKKASGKAGKASRKKKSKSNQASENA